MTEDAPASPFTPPAPPAVVAQLLAAAAEVGFEQSCAPETGALLRVLAASKPAGRLLNLGTGVGVSSAWLLDGMAPEAELWTVDVDPVLSAVAERHLRGSIRFVVEDAAAFLDRTAADGERFDLVFADAMPGKYESRESALDIVAPGGWYVVDDLRPIEDWPEGARLAPGLVAELDADPRFVTMSLDWSTGHLIAARRP